MEMEVDQLEECVGGTYNRKPTSVISKSFAYENGNNPERTIVPSHTPIRYQPGDLLAKRVNLDTFRYYQSYSCTSLALILYLAGLAAGCLAILGVLPPHLGWLSALLLPRVALLASVCNVKVAKQIILDCQVWYLCSNVLLLLMLWWLLLGDARGIPLVFITPALSFTFFCDALPEATRVSTSKRYAALSIATLLCLAITLILTHYGHDLGMGGMRDVPPSSKNSEPLHFKPLAMMILVVIANLLLFITKHLYSLLRFGDCMVVLTCRLKTSELSADKQAWSAAEAMLQERFEISFKKRFQKSLGPHNSSPDPSSGDSPRNQRVYASDHRPQSSLQKSSLQRTGSPSVTFHSIHGHAPPSMRRNQSPDHGDRSRDLSLLVMDSPASDYRHLSSQQGNTGFNTPGTISPWGGSPKATSRAVPPPLLVTPVSAEMAPPPFSIFTTGPSLATSTPTPSPHHYSYKSKSPQSSISGSSSRRGSPHHCPGGVMTLSMACVVESPNRMQPQSDPVPPPSQRSLLDGVRISLAQESVNPRLKNRFTSNKSPKNLHRGYNTPDTHRSPQRETRTLHRLASSDDFHIAQKRNDFHIGRHTLLCLSKSSNALSDLK